MLNLCRAKSSNVTRKWPTHSRTKPQISSLTTWLQTIPVVVCSETFTAEAQSGISFARGTKPVNYLRTRCVVSQPQGGRTEWGLAGTEKKERGWNYNTTAPLVRVSPQRHVKWKSVFVSQCVGLCLTVTKSFVSATSVSRLHRASSHTSYLDDELRRRIILIFDRTAKATPESSFWIFARRVCKWARASVCLALCFLSLRGIKEDDQRRWLNCCGKRKTRRGRENHH